MRIQTEDFTDVALASEDTDDHDDHTAHDDHHDHGDEEDGEDEKKDVEDGHGDGKSCQVMKVTKERSCLVVNRVILCVIKKRICDVSPLASFFRRSLIIWPDFLLFRKLPHAKKIGTRMMG